MAVDTPCVQYKAMADEGSWDLCADLLGGTPAMRSARTKWLPQEPDEKTKNYNVRLKRSFLNNAYKDTIEKYVARPFSRPAIWNIKGNDEALAAIDPIMENMDGEGMHHQAFAKEVFDMLMRWGVASTFVDYPAIDNPDETTKADEQAENLQPLCSVLKTTNVIGWESKKQKNGTDKLIEVRVKETHIADTDNWEQTVYDQIRVITPEGYKLWRREKRAGRTGNSEEYVPNGGGTFVMAGKAPDEIPIVTGYTKKTGMLTSLPPFLELAWVNLEDWISRSDQKNILRFDRFGILVGSGFTEDEVKKGLTVAPTQAILSENPEAKMARVETNGKPAENGWNDIHDISERMEILGMAPMIQRLANVKATGIAANESKSRSQIESWIEEANLVMRKTMQLILAWMGFDVALDDIEYNIYQDFVFSTQQAQEVKDVIEARKMGDLSHRTFIREMQRFGRLSDKVDPDEEKALVEVEKGRGLSLFNNAQTQQGAGAGQPIGEVGATI